MAQEKDNIEVEAGQDAPVEDAGNTVDLTQYTKKELVALCAEKAIELSGRESKGDLLSLLDPVAFPPTPKEDEEESAEEAPAKKVTVLMPNGNEVEFNSRVHGDTYIEKAQQFARDAKGTIPELEEKA